MLIFNFIFSLALGVVLAILFTAGFAQGARPFSKRWWIDVGAFCFLVFVATWAAGGWLPPHSLLVGVVIPIAAAALIAVIFSLASHRRKVHDPSVVRAGPTAVRASAVMQGQVFVIVMFFLTALVVAGYWIANTAR
jgi:hypothetical protein